MSYSHNGYVGLRSFRQPPPQGGLLVLRHSERFPILCDEDAYTAVLTENGKQMARELGMALAASHHLGELLASPVLRCVQTAEEILNGFTNGSRPDVRVKIAPILHFDLTLAGIDELATIYMDDPTTRRLLAYPSSKSHQDLVKALLEQLPFPQEPGKVNIAVSHDTLVSFLYGHFLPPVQTNAVDYPNFLEGFYLVKENGAPKLYKG